MSLPQTISDLLGQQAASHGDALALQALTGPGLSYRALDELTGQAADSLAQSGVVRGDRVAIVLPNGPEMAASFLSVTKVATAAPLNPALKKAEFEFYLKDLDARVLILALEDKSEASGAALKLGIPIVTLHPASEGPAGAFSWEPRSNPGGRASTGPESSDIALVLHTSGTTARPKIVPLSHENLCRSAMNVAETLQLGPKDRCLNVMPLFHIHGLVAALLASLARGASVVCSPGFQAPDFFQWMAACAPTWYTAVPTMHQGILGRAGEAEKEIARKSGLRLIRSSSASLPPTILRDLETAFGVPVVEAYGMTEAAHQMASNPLPPLQRKPGSVGPAAGPEVAIADESGRFLGQKSKGEVVIRGPNVTGGYHGMDDQSAYFFGEGWFRTGDQGYLDADGYLFLTGRLKEIINRGGETLAPREIDEALLEHPGVVQAVAFSVPDPALGEEVAAAVILGEGAETDEAALQDFLLPRLSWARMPKRILILSEIPKGPTGKLQRIGLAAKLGLESVRRNLGEPGAGGPGDPKQASDDTLERLKGLWQEVLKNPDLDPDERFSEAGGDSITATTLVVRVEEEFSIELPLMAFFDAETIRRQASLIDELLLP